MKETRTIKAEFKSKDEDGNKIVGYAAKFNSYSEEMWGFREKIEPGAFGKNLPTADVRALFNHDPNMVIARNKSNTLTLVEDEIGLRFEADLPDTQWAKDLKVSMQRGDIDQCSFGFRTIGDKWEIIDGKDVRTLTEVELFDVSVVTYPAYPETESQVRSLYEEKRSQLHENIPAPRKPEDDKSQDWLDLKLKNLDRLEKLHNLKGDNQ